jgi:nitric oxide reductase large subunit
MAHGVVHRALHTAIVAIRWLAGAFVTSGPPTAPTRRYSCDGGCSSQRSVAVSILLVFVLVIAVALAVATALGLSPDIGLALSLRRLGDRGVPGVAPRCLGTLVRQAEERRNILYVVGGELL